MCGEPGSPSKKPGDHSECGDDTEKCPHCEYWKKDHSKEIDVKDTKFAKSSQYPSAATVKFRFEARLAKGDIMVTLIFKWKTLDAALTEAMKTKVKDALQKDVCAEWSNAHSVKVTDPICGEKTLPVKFRILWNPDETTDTRHYDVNLSKTPVTSSVAYPNANLDHDADLNDSAWTLKHEFGHAFGLHDEYFYSGVTSATVAYNRADGSKETITLEPAANIMRKRKSTKIEKRFIYFAEIEAQELLRAKSGRQVVCKVV